MSELSDYVPPRVPTQEEIDKINPKKLGIIDVAIEKLLENPDLAKDYFKRVFREKIVGDYETLKRYFEPEYSFIHKTGKSETFKDSKVYGQQFEVMKKALWLYIKDKYFDKYQNPKSMENIAVYHKTDNKKRESLSIEEIEGDAYNLMDERDNYTVVERKERGIENLFIRFEKIFLKAWEEYKQEREGEEGPAEEKSDIPHDLEKRIADKQNKYRISPKEPEGKKLAGKDDD